MRVISGENVTLYSYKGGKCLQYFFEQTSAVIINLEE